MSKNDPYVRLRIPEDIKQWVMDAAKSNRRSMTSEIVFLLETAMQKKKGEATA